MGGLGDLHQPPPRNETGWISDALSLLEKRSGTRPRKYRGQGPTFFKGQKFNLSHPGAALMQTVIGN